MKILSYNCYLIYSISFQKEFGFFTTLQLKLKMPNVFMFYSCTSKHILSVSPLFLNKHIQFACVTITRIVFSETYWIPNSFLNASNHSKFSIAATANVQVNYEQQIFDKEKSSDLGWQASILAKVSSCKTSRYMRKLSIARPRSHCQGKTKICCNLTVLCAR